VTDLALIGIGVLLGWTVPLALLAWLLVSDELRERRRLRYEAAKALARDSERVIAEALVDFGAVTELDRRRMRREMERGGAA
jgi:hypothetical protein